MMLKNKRGQSMVEFCLVLPVFLLLSLGLIQLGILFVNSFGVQYAAYMTARCAVVMSAEADGEDKSGRQKNAEKAFGMLSTGMDYMNHGNVQGLGRGIIENALRGGVENLLGISEDTVTIEQETFSKSAGKFIKVTVAYKMPLKVPVANKVFALFGQKSIRDSILDGDLDSFLKNLLARTPYVTPVYTIRKSAIMRAEI